jgi:hypothetical protein
MFFSSKKVEAYPEIFINYNDPQSTVPVNPVVPMICINLSPTPVMKFLGVYFDPNLNFKHHISYISTKISKALFFLRQAKNSLNQRALKLIYHSLLHSNLIYAIQVWTSTNENNIKPLFLKQKAAIRIISNSKYNAHTEPLFKQLNILPLPQL